MEELGALLAKSRFYRNEVDHPDFIRFRQLLQQTLLNKDAVRPLFVLLAHVRDIAGGRGERVLTYMMIDVWYQVYPVMAVQALHAIVTLGYGSWRDMKGLCGYLRQHSIRSRPEDTPEEHPLIRTAVEMMVQELRQSSCSTVAKWVPRECSKKWTWLFDLFVQVWYGGGKKRCGTEQKRAFRKFISQVSCDGYKPSPVVSLVRRCGMRSLESWIKRLNENEDELDREWQIYVRRWWKQFPPFPVTEIAIPVLYFSPEVVRHRALIWHAVVEMLLIVQGKHHYLGTTTRIFVATTPPKTVELSTRGFSKTRLHSPRQ